MDGEKPKFHFNVEEWYEDKRKSIIKLTHMLQKIRLVDERLEFGIYETMPIEEVIISLVKANKPSGPYTDRIVYIMEWYGEILYEKVSKRLYIIGESASLEKELIK